MIGIQMICTWRYQASVASSGGRQGKEKVGKHYKKAFSKTEWEGRSNFIEKTSKIGNFSFEFQHSSQQNTVITLWFPSPIL